MDKDFHFGTIYVLSRWAQFGSYNSLVIATASQFVDDNIETISGEKRTSGHAVLDNLTNFDENNDVWIPFHFLPGLLGEKWDEKLICRKNSELAQRMMNELPVVDVDDSVSVLRLGIALHVYADTWAHQGFSGMPSLDNNVTNLQPKTKSIEDFIENHTIQTGALPLGHMEAVHLPDRPYMQWGCTPQFPEGRNNWDEFMDACHEIYKILTQISTGISSDLNPDQEAMLLDSFQSIIGEDIDYRIAEWLKRIHQNQYHFTDWNDEDSAVEYKESFIMDDDDFSQQFYEALDAHYDWVKNNLLDAGIDVLGEETMPGL